MASWSTGTNEENWGSMKLRYFPKVMKLRDIQRNSKSNPLCKLLFPNQHFRIPFCDLLPSNIYVLFSFLTLFNHTVCSPVLLHILALHIHCAPDRKCSTLTDKIQTTFAKPKIVWTHDTKAVLVLPI